MQTQYFALIYHTKYTNCDRNNAKKEEAEEKICILVINFIHNQSNMFYSFCLST